MIFSVVILRRALFARRRIPTASTAELCPKEENPGTATTGQSTEPAVEKPAVEKKPAASTSTAQVREKINDMIRKELPALTDAYNQALQKEADRQAMKKQPQKETTSGKTETKATKGRS